MNKFVAALREFHSLFFRKTGDWRADINQKFIADNPTAKARAKLIAEEANELCEALETGTQEDVRKELCDVLYVAFALAAIYDLPVDEDFDLVHQNNMLKFETGSLNKETGKFVKHHNHPKVQLPSDYRQHVAHRASDRINAELSRCIDVV